MNQNENTHQSLANKLDIEILGARTNMDSHSTLPAVALCAILFAILSAALQEIVHRTPGFVYAEYFTLVTTLTYMVCGSAMMSLTHDERKRSWGQYAILASLSYCGLLLTNRALRHVSYTTRVVFKSSKVLPVKVLSYLSSSRQGLTSINEWLSTVLIVLGILIFTADDFKTDKTFNALGVLQLILAVCCDAACAIYEEKRFFRTKDPSSMQEVITFSSLWASCYGVSVFMMSPSLLEAIAYMTCHIYVTPFIIFSALMGFLSLFFILTVMKLYGATEAEIIKSLRRLSTMLVSFVVFRKRMGIYHIIGIIFVMIGTTRSFKLTRKRILQEAQPCGIYDIEPK